MTRDDAIATLADEIVQTGRPVHAATIADAVLDEPLISNEDAVTLRFGTEEAKLDAGNRIDKTIEAVVVLWLRNSPRGTALVAERIEREREDEEEEMARSAA